MPVPRINASAKFTEMEVREIKIRLQGGASPREIAKLFGVASETIRKIHRGDTWAWVTVLPRADDAEMAAAAESSLEKMQRLLASQKAGVEKANAAVEELKALSPSTAARLKALRGEE